MSRAEIGEARGAVRGEAARVVVVDLAGERFDRGERLLVVRGRRAGRSVPGVAERAAKLPERQRVAGLRQLVDGAAINARTDAIVRP